MANDLKILYANKFFYIKGGVERVFFQDRQFLLEHGIKVVDFSMQDPHNHYSPYANSFIEHIDYADGNLASMIKAAATFTHSPEAVRKITELVRIEKPDIAHLHCIYHQLTPSIIPPLKKIGCKVVLTMHDYKLVCPIYLMVADGKICDACSHGNYVHAIRKRCGGGMLKSLLLCLEAWWHTYRSTYEQVDLFIAPSRFMADMAARRIPRHKIRLLYNGVETDYATPNWVDKGYGLYLGRLSHEKGLETVLKAHQSLPGMLPFKVVGTGPQENDLKRKYHKADFLGYRQGEELNRLITEAAFVVVPSEWYENFSMVVLEAMTAGKPVIGSRVGGIPEQVLDGISGYLFDMGDTEALAARMGQLYADSSLRQNLGRAARQRVEDLYSLQRHGEDLLDIYHELMMKS